MQGRLLHAGQRGMLEQQAIAQRAQTAIVAYRLSYILELSVVMQGAMRGARLLASNWKVVAMPSSF